MLKRLSFPAVCAFALVAAQGLAVAGNGADLIKQVPETSQMVLVIDMAEARDSPLLLKYYQKLLDAQPDAQAKLASIGLDPIKDIDTVFLAGGGTTELAMMKDSKDIVLIIEGRLPKDRFQTIPGMVKSKHQGIEIWAKDDTEAAFVGGRLFFAKKGKMPGAIDVALGKGGGRGKNAGSSAKAKKLRAAIAQTNTKSDAWMVVLIPDKDKTTMKQSGMEVDSLTMALKFTADIAASLRLNAKDDATAAKAVGMIQPLLPQLTGGLKQMGLGKVATSITVAQDKAAIMMTGVLTDGELNTLIALAGGGSAAPAPAPAPKPAPVVPKTGGLGGGVKTSPTP